MLAASLLSLLLCADAKPAGLSVSTWVREDIFKGFLVNDSAGLDQGMAKLEAILAENPKSGEALAWHAGGLVYRAVRAFEGGRRSEFDALYAKAKAEFAQSREVATTQDMVGVLAVHGGTFAIMADRLPEEFRRDGWMRVRDNYGALKAFQKDYWDRLPVHMTGEVLAGLAQAEQRLTGSAGEAMADLLKTESVYATRARRWQEKPEMAAKSSLTCQTCHEPGRLHNVLARQKN
jgi:hypothetical protein